MSSEEEVFFDTTESLVCGSSKWNDNADNLIRSSFEFDSRSARRRSRVEPSKKISQEKLLSSNFAGCNSDERDKVIVTVTGNSDTPKDVVKTVQVTDAHPGHSQNSCFMSGINYHNPSIAYSNTDVDSFRNIYCQGLTCKSLLDQFGPMPNPLESINHTSSDVSEYLNLNSVTNNVNPPLQQASNINEEQCPGFTQSFRSQVVSSAPEFYACRLDSNKNKSKYIKFWSLDAAKYQSCTSAPCHTHFTLNPQAVRKCSLSEITANLESRIVNDQIGPAKSQCDCCHTNPTRPTSQLGDYLNNLNGPRHAPDFSRSTVLTNQTGQIESSLSYPYHHTHPYSNCCQCRLVSTMVQTDDHKDFHLSHKDTLVFTRHSAHNFTKLASTDATLLGSEQFGEMKSGDKSSKLSLVQRYFRGALSAMRSVTRNKIVESTDEDEEVIGSQGIRLRSSIRAKGRRQFLQIKLVQEIKNEHDGAIWAMRFSPCGRLLATAGYDRKIRIWVLRQWYAYFKKMQHASTDDSSFGMTTFRRGEFPLSATQVNDQDILLDSLSLTSNSVSASEKTDDGVSSSSSVSAHPQHIDQVDESSTTGMTRSKQSSSALHRNSRSAFRSRPLLVLRGHEGVLTELTWSKNLFLLSTSMDHQVRLWHVSQQDCLCVFNHNDTVPTIVFHPKDDRYFLSGSLDGKLRLWNIPDKRVQFWVEVPMPSALPIPTLSSVSNSLTVSNMFNRASSPLTFRNSTKSSKFIGPKTVITCAAFACEGTKVVVGTYDGRVMFFNNELTYITFIAIKSGSTMGHYCRVTGIEPDPSDSNKILVTSNDSRIRLIDARDYHTICKYRGFVNQTSQIRASFSPTGRYIISGSENPCFYIWQKSLELERVSRFSYTRKDRNGCWEAVKAHDTMVTVAVFSPNPNLALDTNLRHHKFNANHSSQLIRTGSYHAPLDDYSMSSGQASIPVVYLGEMIVSADCNGCIRVFKNYSLDFMQSLSADA